MNFYPNLYVGENVRSLRLLKRRLKRGFPFTKAYVITFAAGQDLLEIYDSRVFAQKYYRNFPRMIVGLASDYDEAVELVIRIMEESLQHRGDCNVKAYLEERMSKERQD